MAGRPEEDLVRPLLTDTAERNEDVARAGRSGQLERIAVSRAEGDRRLRTRRYLGYRESSEWAGRRSST